MQLQHAYRLNEMYLLDDRWDLICKLQLDWQLQNLIDTVWLELKKETIKDFSQENQKRIDKALFAYCKSNILSFKSQWTQNQNLSKN